MIQQINSLAETHIPFLLIVDFEMQAPLLKGTMRTYLLETGQIAEAIIRPEDLPLLTEARMINCMMDLESSPAIQMNRIIF